MKSLLNRLWNAEPARVLGFAGFLILTVATQLLDNGIVTSNGTTNILHFIIAVTPLLLAEVTRSQVSPAP